MADHSSSSPHTDAHPHHGPTFQMYMIVALVLAVCTASSFLFNTMMHKGMITPFVSFLLILIVALIKATLVVMVFMHLKWDWNLLYFLLVPALILGVMMMVVLLPDMVIGQVRDADEAILSAQEQERALTAKKATN